MRIFRKVLCFLMIHQYEPSGPPWNGRIGLCLLTTQWHKCRHCRRETQKTYCRNPVV